MGKMKEDPYVYPGTDILINKLDIKDKAILAKAEKIITYKKLSEFEFKAENFGKTSEKQVREIHKYLFGDLYPFAGEFRKINIYKAEKELGGDSFPYCDSNRIQKELYKVCNSFNSLKVSNDIDSQTKAISGLAAEVWAVHPFREGNTRTTMCVAQLYAEGIGVELATDVIKRNPKEFRDALLLHSLPGQYSEPDKLRAIIKESILIGEKNRELGIIGEAKVIESAKSPYNPVTGKYIPVAEKLPEYKTNAWISEKQIDEKIKVKEGEKPLKTGIYAIKDNKAVIKKENIYNLEQLYVSKEKEKELKVPEKSLEEIKVLSKVKEKTKDRGYER